MIKFLILLMFFSVNAYSRPSSGIVEEDNTVQKADGWVTCGEKFNETLQAQTYPSGDGCFIMTIKVSDQCKDSVFSFLCQKEVTKTILSYKDFLVKLKPDVDFVGIQVSNYYGTTKVFYKYKSAQ